MRRITIIRRADTLYCVRQATSTPDAPPSLLIPPVERVAVDADAAIRLGELALLLLHEPVEIIPWPTDWAGFFKPMLKGYGVRSQVELIRSSVSITVAMQDPTDPRAELMPSSSRDLKMGFAALPDRNTVVSTDDPAAFGRALLAALDRCEPWLPAALP